jgi:hypothetical protein
VKKFSFLILSVLLSFCFILSGCNLFIENESEKLNQIAVEAGDFKLTREELLKGYNNYYDTFYSQNQNDSEKAMKALIEYLISKKIYISDSQKLIDEGKIVLTDAEKNYIWYSVYTALINNINSFEKKIKEELNIEDEEKEELEKEDQFVYTPYNKIAEVVFNEETGEYEISILKTVLVEITDEETGEKKYEYVSQEKSSEYPISELFDADYIKNLINVKKLYEGKNNLTEEEIFNKSISKESIRRYIDQLKNNEKGKNLSTEEQDIFDREISRIYNIVYENLLVNKLYVYKVSQIDVSKEDVLNRYLEKVKSSYERYLLDDTAFTKELTTTVGSAKYYAGYQETSKSIEDIFYVPANTTEKFFYLTHIVISLSEMQVQQINELRQYCEANGLDLEAEDGYYKTEFNKIVDKSKIKLDERDKEGYIVVKKTDENAITLEQMLTNLQTDMEEIEDKYYGEDGSITLATEPSVIKKLEIDYQNERADKFNEYIYKYTDDTGTLQIQKTITGEKNENWYTYGLGTNETDAGFVDNFVDAARDLFNNGAGKITSFKEILMQNWSTPDSKGVTTLKTQSTGYSVIMYAGQVSNLFESFDNKDFNLSSLPNDALLIMDYYRLGLTMNKTLFDLIFEECYDNLYDEIIKVYEESILKDINIITHENVYRDLLK